MHTSIDDLQLFAKHLGDRFFIDEVETSWNIRVDHVMDSFWKTIVHQVPRQYHSEALHLAGRMFSPEALEEHCQLSKNHQYSTEHMLMTCLKSSSNDELRLFGEGFEAARSKEQLLDEVDHITPQAPNKILKM